MRSFTVTFYKDSVWFGQRKEITVNAETHEAALKKARAKGYLKRDGWIWTCICPNT